MTGLEFPGSLRLLVGGWGSRDKLSSPERCYLGRGYLGSGGGEKRLNPRGVWGRNQEGLRMDAVRAGGDVEDAPGLLPEMSRSLHFLHRE